MSVHLRVVNLQNVFDNLKTKPIIINDFRTTNVEDKNYIKDLIYAKYDNDVLSSIPRCNCPPSANPVIGADRIGEFCPKCRTRVTSKFDDELQSILWVRAPNGVEPFINPRIWQAIKIGLSFKQVNVLLWLTNKTYNFKSSTRPKILDEIESLGIKRGYNNFVRNFFEYMNLIAEIKDFKRKAAIRPLMKFIENNKDKIFTNYIPLPNRALFIVEPTPMDKTYMETLSIGAIDAINFMTSIDAAGNTLAQHARENRTSKFLDNMCVFQNEYLRKNIARKPGTYRKHVVASRMAPSFRAVITSITTPHDFEQLIIPWNIAMTIFQPHLENIFLKNGLTANEILEIFNRYINKFNQKLYDLMIKIIYDYTDKGFPTLWNRNPTLSRSSILMLFISDIKKDVDDPTVSMSIGIVGMFNA